MRSALAFLAFAFGSYAVYTAFSVPSSVSEQEIPDDGLPVVDSPENIKVNADQFESGADVDFDLSAYFEDLFNRVNAMTENEINFFLDAWGQ